MRLTTAGNCSSCDLLDRLPHTAIGDKPRYTVPCPTLPSSKQTRPENFRHQSGHSTCNLPHPTTFQFAAQQPTRVRHGARAISKRPRRPLDKYGRRELTVRLLSRPSCLFTQLHRVAGLLLLPELRHSIRGSVWGGETYCGCTERLTNRLRGCIVGERVRRSLQRGAASSARPVPRRRPQAGSLGSPRPRQAPRHRPRADCSAARPANPREPAFSAAGAPLLRLSLSRAEVSLAQRAHNRVNRVSNKRSSPAEVSLAAAVGGRQRRLLKRSRAVSLVRRVLRLRSPVSSDSRQRLRSRSNREGSLVDPPPPHSRSRVRRS